jgi:dihydrofolate synthase/folylpolyglutamate synthase
MSHQPDNYQQTIDYLYERLPIFSRIGKAALKPDLTNTLQLCAALGDPHTKFKSVHIAGTNGKGSTSHALAAILQDAGYKTGLYTSPHLLDFRERIRINGAEVSEEWVTAFVDRIKPTIEAINPSFFEVTVAMAFAYFAEEKVDIAIIETGLGGRLDSTNVITPLLSVITNISYDHKDLLGNTLPEIAAEKAGIIKPGVSVIIGEQHDETERIFFEHSVHKHSPLYYAQSLWGMVRTKTDGQYQYYKAIDNGRREMYDLKTDLLGNYQQHNLKTILTAAEVLSHYDFKLTTEKSIAALANVKKSTGLQGRWDWLQQRPAVICDVAHNPAGLREVLEQWKSVSADRKHVVIGFVKDKDINDALALFPKDAVYHFCNASIPRALPAAELAAIATTYGLTGDIHESVAEATKSAISAMRADDALLITGSFFIVGEAMEVFKPEMYRVTDI